MNKTITLVLFLFFVLGCVSVDMPDHLVSDVADVSKDAYHAIKNRNRGKAKGNDKYPAVYCYTHVGHDDETVRAAKAACFEKAKLKAGKDLQVDNTEDITAEIVSEDAELAENHIIVRCKIAVTYKATADSETRSGDK